MHSIYIYICISRASLYNARLSTVQGHITKRVKKWLPLDIFLSLRSLLNLLVWLQDQYIVFDDRRPSTFFGGYIFYNYETIYSRFFLDNNVTFFLDNNQTSLLAFYTHAHTRTSVHNGIEAFSNWKKWFLNITKRTNNEQKFFFQ